MLLDAIVAAILAPLTALIHLYSLIVSPSTFTPTESSLLSTSLQFELRQQHVASGTTGQIMFSNVNQADMKALSVSSYDVQTRRTVTHKPTSNAAFTAARTSSMVGLHQTLHWDDDQEQGPDVENRQTLLTLAKMANNAYLTYNETGWYDLEGNWTVVGFSKFS